MNTPPAPLEYLVSYAITFAAGVITTAALSACIKWSREKAETINDSSE